MELQTRSKLGVDLPEGCYEGTMSGYIVTVKAPDGSIRKFGTKQAVQGRGLPVTVKISGGIAHVGLSYQEQSGFSHF